MMKTALWMTICTGLLTATALAADRPSSDPRNAEPISVRAPTPHVKAEGKNLVSLRQELIELKRLLGAQQAQIERQNRRIEQLGRESAGTYAPSQPIETEHVPALPPDKGAARLLVPAELATPPEFGLVPDSESYSACPPLPLQADEPLFRLGGQYRVMFNASNFDFHPATLSNSQDSQNFANERLRTWLTVSPNEHVEGYIQVEIGHVFFGDDLEFPKAFVGPRFPPGDDRVGIELRRGYLGYQSEEVGRLRVGIQDWQDSFDETLASADWDFNVGGVSWLMSCGDMTLLAGGFVLFEGEVDEADDALLFTLDADWHVSEQHTLGISAYYLRDGELYSYPTAAPYDSSWDIWLGIRASAALSSVPIHGFAIFNAGEREELGGLPDFEHEGVALELEAGPVCIGPGRLSFQTLYATGDDDLTDDDSNEFRTVAQSLRDDFGSQGYWSYLVLTSPHGPSDVNDLGVALQNRSFGLFTFQAIYEYPICGPLSGTLAAGWLRAAEDNPASGAAEMGTELASVFTLDLGGGLIVDFGGAVFFTQDFYKPSPVASEPDDLWELFTRVQLEF